MSVILAELIWRPFFPAVAVLLGGALLVALAVFVCVRTWRGRAGLSLGMLLVRLLVIAALVGVLMGPSNLPPVSEAPTRPTLTVLLDTSGSMQAADMDGQARYEFAISQWLSKQQLDAIGDEFKIDLVTFDGQPRQARVDALAGSAKDGATARQSRIADAIEQTIARLPASADGSAVLVISDGKDSGDAPFQPAVIAAKQRSIPVHTVTLGGANLARDIALTASPSQPYLLAGEPGILDIRVVQNNADEAQTTVRVRCGDDESTHVVKFDGQAEQRLQVPIQQDKPGTYEYEVVCDAVDGELETTNNRQQVFIDATAARFRVLLIEGQPYWDTKFIAQSLRKDERVELVQVTQVTQDRQEIVVSRADPKTARLPASLEEFGQFDVVILGGSIEAILSEEVAAMLPRYVSELGGRLVFARGRAYDTDSVLGRRIGRVIGVLEPVVWGRGTLASQEVAVTPAARSHPALSFLHEKAGDDETALAALLPELRRLPVVEREKDSALVLAATRTRGAAGVGQPVVVTMPYPSGRVVAVLGEGLWRWSMLARRNPDLAGVYDQFWSNMVRWLAMGSDYTPGQEVSLKLSSRGVQAGDELRVDVISREPKLLETGELVLITPDGKRQPLAMTGGADASRKYAAIRPDKPGVYTFELSQPVGVARAFDTVQSKFTAYDVDLERLETAADPRPMRMLSEQTGGQVLDPYQPQELGRVLDRYLAMMTLPPQPSYIWDKGFFLVLLLLVAGFEWIARKLGGML